MNVDWRLRAAAWLSERTSTPIEQLDPPQARAMLRRMVNGAALLGLAGRRADVAEVRDIDCGGVPARLYRPTPSATAAVVYFHGGGWVIGDLATHDAVCRSLARASSAVVVAVQYRLAPEHPFPAAPDDAWAAAQFVARTGAALGIDGERIAVGGDSAGGNLAAVVALRAAQEGLRLRGQLLVYPVVDCGAESPSYSEFAVGHFLTRADMRYFIASYLPDRQARLSPAASPLRAPSLAGVAPALVVTAQADVLRDEGRAYAAALRRDGVDVQLLEAAGMLHGFMNMQGLAVPRDCMAKAGAWLANCLSVA